jgi:hypothetical protein
MSYIFHIKKHSVLLPAVCRIATMTPTQTNSLSIHHIVETALFEFINLLWYQIKNDEYPSFYAINKKKLLSCHYFDDN